MVKVYDMVAYGLYESDEIAPPYGYETPQTQHSTATPALQLQTPQLTPTPRVDALPPTLRTADIDRFLETCDD